MSVPSFLCRKAVESPTFAHCKYRCSGERLLALSCAWCACVCMCVRAGLCRGGFVCVCIKCAHRRVHVCVRVYLRLSICTQQFLYIPHTHTDSTSHPQRGTSA